ncbi:amino acid adenylation domain-containing protein [Phenylobacterium haematophilum]|uniref:Phenolphthiocerol/phthiocerol polyketide synthase subunit E n=1 Tax=Phenylobacterium haematophilum TaxID=98513 RepID=A0A839ZZX4_9CAUL|nr:amino acid adenylation domain-containing protein [Phenylobacterium haematophilum]
MDRHDASAAPGNRIAIVGRAGRFPAARNVEEFWAMLRDARNAAQRLTDAELLARGVSRQQLADPNYVRVANVLPDMECFDAGFFGFSPREASILDPQHRHFLECGWEAFEDAGYVPEKFDGRIGVFAGSGMQAYLPFNLLSNPDLVEEIGLFLLRHTGNDKDFLTTRLSYLLNLTGPSVAVQTACSTSLVAVHTAISSLLNMECDMALAGGVTIELPHRVGYRYSEGEILSPDGLCRAFDDDSKGTVFGSGAALVVLRRYEDAVADGDDIKAVILASAVNNDGSGKASYLAPSVDGQAEAAAEALALSGVSPGDISYIETHGTGTPIGDPIELAALQEVYGAAPKAAIGIGSVKTNIGHLDTAAGAASLIKVVEAMRHRTLPASLNFSTPNSRFDFDGSPFRVVAQGGAWEPGGPLRAAVNSLGVGGTNAHVILEEAPRRAAQADDGAWKLFSFSARTRADLDRTRERWAAWLDGEVPNLRDVAFTLREGRRAFGERFTVAARNAQELQAAVSARSSAYRQQGSAGDSAPRIVFLFPGGGAQYPGAGAGMLAAFPVFGEAVRACFAALPATAPADLYDVMFRRDRDDAEAKAKLERSSYAIPALFILEYAYTQLWLSWGVKPDVVLAHSVGEYAGAVAAGTMQLADALKLVALRGKVMDAAPAGAMTSVPLSLERVQPHLGDRLDIAAVNTPETTVVSGQVADIERLEADLAKAGVEARRIHIEVAAHSRQLDGQLEPFRAGFEGVAFERPTVPMASSMRGGWAKDEDLSSAEYWVQHLRNTVRFADAARTVLAGEPSIVIEVGPGQTLGPLLEACDVPVPPRAVLYSSPRPRDATDEVGVALAALGGVWANGAEVDWSLAVPAGGARVSLPTYAFAKDRHWVEPGRGAARETAEEAPELVRRPDIPEWFEELGWSEQARGGRPPSLDGDWLVFAGADPLSEAVLERLGAAGAGLATVRAGAAFGRSGEAFTLRPQAQDDFEALSNALPSPPSRILYLWGLDPALADAAFSGAYLLARLLQQADLEQATHLTFVAQGAASVAGEPLVNPQAAALLGPVRVAPREIPGLSSVLVDVGEGAGLDALLAEAAAPGDSDHVALRAGRFVRSRKAAPVVKPRDLPQRLRKNGVYLITGGTGGIGREMVRWLAEKAQARLIVLSRHAEEDASVRAEIEALGGEVIFVPVDLTDPEATTRALESAAERFGAPNGVVHAAGVLDDAPLALQPLAAALAVMEPKLIGARTLDRLYPDGSLDFFAVVSSTSVLLGGAGQTSYAGANAALEAIAASRKDGFSIAWGAWRDTGMAARAYGAGSVAGGDPLLGARKDVADGSILFESVIDPETDWRVLDHVVNGASVLPGSAYMELAYAAANAVMAQRPFVLDALQFATAMTFERMPRRVVLRLDPAPDGYELVVESRAAMSAEPVEHMRARIVALDAAPPRPEPMGASDLPMSVVSGQPVQNKLIDFGPRWSCVGDIRMAQKQVVGEFALSDAFHGDLALHPLHPALLDMAATVGLALVPLNGDLYAPMSIGRMQVFGPLADRLVAHGELIASEEGRYASFKVAICGADGEVLVQLEDFALRAIADGRLAGAQPRQSVSSQVLSTGIRRLEAPELFARVFDHPARQIVVSPVSIDLLRLAMLEIPEAGQPQRQNQPQQEIADPVTARLAAIWSDILGVAGIAPEDDFFALGGHSLNAVRMIARVRKEFGVSLPLGKLFEAPRLEAFAALLGAGASPPQQVVQAPSELPAAQRSLEPRRVAMTEGQREIAGSILVERSTLIAYNLSFSMHVAGAIELPALRTALNALVDRHEVLRASFDLENATLTIGPQGGFELSENDLSRLGGQLAEAQRDALLRDAAGAPFDLASGPLLRVLSLRLPEGRSELVLIVHHMVCDGWSAGVLMRDLAVLYTAALEGRAAALPPAQGVSALVEAEAQWRGSAEAETHRRFWLDKYASSLPVMDLTFDKPHPATTTTAAARVVTRLDAELEAALRGVAQRADTPLRNLIFASFRYYLSMMVGSPDVTVGIPVAGQIAHGLDDIVAHGVSFLPVRATIERGASLRDLLSQARRDMLEAVEHQNYTHGALVRDLQAPRSSARHLLAPVVVNIDGLADLENIALGAAPVRIEVNSTGHEFFDLFFNQFDAPGRVELTWNYKTDLFLEATIQLHAGNVLALLRAIAETPDAMDRPMAALLSHGRQVAPASGEHADPGAAGPQTVTEVFRGVAAAHAGKVAVRFGDQTLTYAELDQRSDALAAMLAEAGVGPGQLVGISSHRSLSLVVAVLGVLKAGAGYAPFDVSLPEDRLRFMARDTGITVLLGDCPAAAQEGVRIIHWREFPQAPVAAPAVEVTGESIAYVMFTSGTTGTPKGVVLPHRSIIRMLCDTDWLEMSDKTVTLHSSAFAFDTSIIDLFASLLHGGTLVVPPDGTLSISQLADAIQSHGVNTLWLTSGLFHAIADVRPQTFASVKQVIVGGDIVSPVHVGRVMAACPNVVVINGYGPTESCVTNAHKVTQADLSRGMALPIGRAIPGTQSYILDENLNPVPDGIIGELGIAGRGLALGYWNRPELTAEKFVIAPWDPTLKLYRSGDLVLNPGDGVLRFFGRADTQVKVRGFRVELTEIEQALDAHPAIRQSVVAASVPEGQTDKVLAAYFVAQGAAPPAAELRGFLSARLPEFAIPSFFVAVDEIPLNANGKPDRRALPALRSQGAEDDADATLSGETEVRLAKIWSAVLGVKEISADANFFQMGGHSLLAVRLFDRVRSEFGHDLPLSTLFSNQTLRALAALLDASSPAPPTEANPDAEWDTSAIIHPGPGGDNRPLFIAGGVGGNVNNLMELGAQLGLYRAVVGFQTRGVLGHTPHETIEEMAAANIRYMRRHQPTGPYLLAGYSGGSLTAFEMARQLEEAGEQVERLFVLDTYAPGFAKEFRPPVRLGMGEWLLDEFQMLRIEGLPLFFERRARALRQRIMRGRLLTFFKNPSLSHSRYQIMQDIWMAAARKYEGGKISAPVTLFRTRPQRLLARRALELDPTLGWGAVSNPSTVETPWVEGDHLGMLKDQNARMLANLIESRITPQGGGATTLEMKDSIASISPNLARSA